MINVPYTLLLLLGLFWSTTANAQVLRVSQSAWSELAQAERAEIQRTYVIELINPNSFGTIVDTQGIDESTPGNTGGTQFGAAVAEAAYLDNAFKGRNYSSKNHLAAGLLGAILGSALNSSARPQFHFRYAIKLGTGDVRYFDEIKSDAFRHSPGICVTVPEFGLSDQHLCGQTADTLRKSYLNQSKTEVQRLSVDKVIVEQGAPAKLAEPGSNITCQIGTLAPVTTSAEKCVLINGKILQ